MHNSITANSVLTLGDLLVPLSAALDLTAGQPAGHAVRTSVIGMRIAKMMGLSDEKVLNLSYALLLKDAGASSAASHMCDLFGEQEVEAKRAYRFVDWSNLAEADKFLSNFIKPHYQLQSRTNRAMRSSLEPSSVSARISREKAVGGEAAVRLLSLDTSISECLMSIDEHWDGSGGPAGLMGRAIPLFSRIASFAQTLDAFVTTLDIETAYSVIAQQAGRKFDPEIFEITRQFMKDERFWTNLKTRPRAVLVGYEGAFLHHGAPDAHVDGVCHVFGAIVDAKTPFTRGHSKRVSQYATQIGQTLDLPIERLQLLRRAALLHDIGKLTVPNFILEKPDALSPDEWMRIKKYPLRTEQILSPIRGFQRLAEVACSHNERLDGSGYHHGVKADQLDLEMRIIAAADMYDALSSDRPHRAALPPERVINVLEHQSATRLDDRCVFVLKNLTKARAPLGGAPVAKRKAA